MALGRSTHLPGPHTHKAESFFFYMFIEDIFSTRLDVIKSPFQCSGMLPYLSESQKRDSEESTLSQKPALHSS